jgi:hypothetical protein
MTEDEWLKCTSPTHMLQFLRGKASDRKLRLFVCARCRRIWHLMEDERSRNAVEVAERYADDQARGEEREAATVAARHDRADALAARHASGYKISECPTHAATAAYLATLDVRSDREEPVSTAEAVIAVCSLIETYRASKLGGRAGHALACCRLVRELFGNPFRPIRLKSSWLAWNDGTVPKLAQAIYDERRFADLPILADALEEAGCTDADILAHCRQPGEHVRGCWVVDLLLGKE